MRAVEPDEKRAGRAALLAAALAFLEQHDLVGAARADRLHEPAAVGELVDERLRQMRERGRDEDPWCGACSGEPAALVSAHDRHVLERRGRASDRLDVRALAAALPRCRLVTCDAFMAEVVRRTALDVRFRCELFTGRRADVERLRRRLEVLS